LPCALSLTRLKRAQAKSHEPKAPLVLPGIVNLCIHQLTYEPSHLTIFGRTTRIWIPTEAPGIHGDGNHRGAGISRKKEKALTG
jgi:hypothetical protein